MTLLLVIATGYVSAQLASIRSGWEIVLELGAGTGSVYMLRWYWWRINAWSEISAMASSLAVTAAIRSSTLASIFLHRNSFFSGNSSVVFAKTSLVTTLVTSCAWISVTLLTKPEHSETLVAFYRKVRPQINGWEPVAAQAREIPETRDLGRNLWCWFLGCVMTYSALLGVGKLLLHHRTLGFGLSFLAILTAWQMSRELRSVASDARPNDQREARGDLTGEFTKQ